VGFYDALQTKPVRPEDAATASVQTAEVEAVLRRERLSLSDLPLLLSPAALPLLEPMAQRAAALTRRHFGSAMNIFTPLYIANYCVNPCPYCSFSRHQQIARKQLSLEEVEEAARHISASGIRHLLVLTGEARTRTSIDYIESSIKLLSGYFSSIAIEIYPLSTAEYGRLIGAGVDGLTIYQEVYDEVRYHELHHGGPKDDYAFRLDAPDRGCQAGMRRVTIGPLLGLGDILGEALVTGRHLAYLQRSYPDVELAVSFLRLRPQVGQFQPSAIVSDSQLVQLITAFRLVFPTVGITLSTRESARFRDSVAPLGITKMSAGVSTAVGGHLDPEATSQFEIADHRGVDEMRRNLLALGFQPVMHDWSMKLVES
jgi:2-iminoacetate synthase